MDSLLFAASFDALAFVVKRIRGERSVPELTEHVPVLFYSCSSCAWDPETGRILESIRYGFYDIGWNLPQDLTDVVEVSIWGTRVFVHRDTLERLSGKQLVLRNVDSGGRGKPGADRQLLIEVDQAPSQLNPNVSR